MFKKIITFNLCLICITFVFAQIPPSLSEEEESNYLVYNPSRDSKAPEYLWGVSVRYSHVKDTFTQILDSGVILFTIKEDSIQEKSTNISDKAQAEKNKLENELNKKNREQDLSDMVKNSFKVWFQDTKAMIEKTGRSEEFKDIMPILNRDLNIKEINNAYEYYPNIMKFHFTNLSNMQKICGGQDAGACSNSFNLEITAVDPYVRDPFFTRKLIFASLIHEIGHFFGLADQYSNYNSDNTHSTTDRFIRGGSVMGANFSSHLSCDDVDGFINVIDLTLSKTKGWSNRAKNGWASFCNGKQGYKSTFYKEARVLNKAPYKSNDKCVYTFTAEGKIDKKYCPKLWSFARPNDKLTYGKSGLIINKKDEKFNYKYSYTRENGSPVVNVLIMNSLVQHTSTKKSFNGKQAWQLPSGYSVSTNGDSYIYVDSQNCNIVNYVPFSDKKAYSVDFVNNNIQSEYIYSFPIGSNTIDMRKNRSKENRVCTVNWLGDEIIKFEKGIFSKDISGNIGQDRFYLKVLAEENNMTKDQLVEQLKKECKKDLHQSIIDNSKALCNYFRDVDNYFNK